LNFVLLTTKREAFILAPKCTNVESLVKIRPTLFKILFVLTTFRTHGETMQTDRQADRHTDSRTARKHTDSGHYVDRGIKLVVG